MDDTQDSFLFHCQFYLFHQTILKLILYISFLDSLAVNNSNTFLAVLLNFSALASFLSVASGSID